jgi:hypothetical protein
MSEYYKFYRFYELSKGDVFKWNENGVFYTVLSIDKVRESCLIQTSYGKLRNYQIGKAKFNSEVLLFPDKRRLIK